MTRVLPGCLNTQVSIQICNKAKNTTAAIWQMTVICTWIHFSQEFVICSKTRHCG